MSDVINHIGRCEKNKNKVSRVGKNICRDKVNDCSDFIISILLTETVGERQDEINDTREQRYDTIETSWERLDKKRRDERQKSTNSKKNKQE